jgi:hypothetical protein
MSSDALGTALVLTGTFLAALGYVLQKRAHLASERAVAGRCEEPDRNADVPPRLLRGVFELRAVGEALRPV